MRRPSTFLEGGAPSPPGGIRLVSPTPPPRRRRRGALQGRIASRAWGGRADRDAWAPRLPAHRV